MPGLTLFMPVCDVSRSLISLIAQFVDGGLQRFAPQRHRGMNIVDDRRGLCPAGTGTWLKSGFLDQEAVMPLSILERQACYFMFSEPAMICQNIFLATETLGIGGWMHCGFLSSEVLAALGFRTVMPGGVAALANPVGLDGIFEACCPPYYPNMDAAVDAVIASLSREDNRSQSTGPVPYLISEAEHHAGTVEITDEGIACTNAVCNYIY